eukprot:scaffold1188_cov124-Isochrysis_galbana.AAC.3
MELSLERLAEQRLRLVQLALVLKQAREVVHRAERARVACPQHLARRLERLVEQRLHLGTRRLRRVSRVSVRVCSMCGCGVWGFGVLGAGHQPLASPRLFRRVQGPQGPDDPALRTAHRPCAGYIKGLHTDRDSAVKHPYKKYDVITICSDRRSEARQTAATTGPGMATGNALRREQAAIRRSDRRTHLGDVTAHWATEARGATLTSAWSCLADACADGETASH